MFLVSITSAMLSLAVTSTTPSPGMLAHRFAPVPLDVISDSQVAGPLSWRMVVAIIVRAFAAYLLVMAVRGRLKTRKRPQLRPHVQSYLLAWAVALLSAILVRAYVALQSHPESKLAGLGVLLLIVGLPIGYVVATRFIAPLGLGPHSHLGPRTRPHARHRSIWIYSGASLWLWLFTANRIDDAFPAPSIVGYFLAFCVIALQSLLLGAILISAVPNEKAPNNTAPDHAIAEPTGS